MIGKTQWGGGEQPSPEGSGKYSLPQIGKYPLVRQIGEGAMGVVFEARHPVIGNPIAIKILRADEFASAEELAAYQQRFFNEARRAGALSHPNIVRIHDIDSQGALTFMVMELVEGVTLEDLLTDGLPFDPIRTLTVLRQVASALDHAHAKNIVHRDIKPGNILIDAEDRVKVTDFGVAKDLSEMAMTRTGTMLGTPHFMAPEQVQNLAVDGRADQFALAVVAFRLLTGHFPFDADGLGALVYKIVHDPPQDARVLAPALGEPVAGVLERGLQKDPAERFSACMEFVKALERAMGIKAAPVPDHETERQTIYLTPESGAVPAATHAPPATEAWPERPVVYATTDLPISRRQWLLYFAIPAGAVSVGFLLHWLTRPTRKTPPTTPAAGPEARLVRVRHLLLGTADLNAAGVQERRRLAETLMNQLRGGADFNALVSTHSDDTATREKGGDLGYISRGQLVAPVEEVAFRLPVNQISEVVTSPYGFHILQVIDRWTKAEPPPDPEPLVTRSTGTATTKPKPAATPRRRPAPPSADLTIIDKPKPVEIPRPLAK